MCQKSISFTWIYFIFGQIFECRFPGFNIRAIGARLEVRSLWEAICDSKEGQMGKNFLKKTQFDGKELMSQRVISSFSSVHGVGL